MERRKKYMILGKKRRRRWHPTPVLSPGESMDGGAWPASPWGHRVRHDKQLSMHIIIGPYLVSNKEEQCRFACFSFAGLAMILR